MTWTLNLQMEMQISTLQEFFIGIKINKFGFFYLHFCPKMSLTRLQLPKS